MWSCSSLLVARFFCYPPPTIASFHFDGGDQKSLAAFAAIPAKRTNLYIEVAHISRPYIDLLLHTSCTRGLPTTILGQSIMGQFELTPAKKASEP